MNAEQFYARAVELRRLYDQVEQVEEWINSQHELVNATLAKIKAETTRLSTMKMQSHTLANTLDPALEAVGVGEFVEACGMILWLDEDEGVCYAKVKSWQDVPTVADASPNLTDEQLAELAFQQAVADMEAGEDEPEPEPRNRLTFCPKCSRVVPLTKSEYLAHNARPCPDCGGELMTCGIGHRQDPTRHCAVRLANGHVSITEARS